MSDFKNLVIRLANKAVKQHNLLKYVSITDYALMHALFSWWSTNCM